MSGQNTGAAALNGIRKEAHIGRRMAHLMMCANGIHGNRCRSPVNEIAGETKVALERLERSALKVAAIAGLYDVDVKGQGKCVQEGRDLLRGFPRSPKTAR